MTGITMPEVIIYKALENIIKYIRKELNTKTNEKETILYKLLGVDEDGKSIAMNRYNYFVQAKKMFLSLENLSVNFGYNFEVAKTLSLHIILPAESPIDATIGEDEGYGDEEEDGMIQQKFTQMFNSTYQVMITSTNSSEINVIYHVLKSMLIAIVPHLSLMGLLNPKFSGNDIVFQDDLMPSGIFHKVINLSFTYELTVPQLVVQDIIKGVIFEGNMLDYIQNA